MTNNGMNAGAPQKQQAPVYEITAVTATTTYTVERVPLEYVNEVSLAMRDKDQSHIYLGRNATMGGRFVKKSEIMDLGYQVMREDSPVKPQFTSRAEQDDKLEKLRDQNSIKALSPTPIKK